MSPRSSLNIKGIFIDHVHAENYIYLPKSQTKQRTVGSPKTIVWEHLGK